MTRFLLLFIILLSPALMQAQTTSGSIYGVVIDAETKETVIGAYVLIKDLGIGGVTDFDGNYSIRNVPVGKHIVTVSYVGYNTITLTDVMMEAGQRLKLDLLLERGNAELDEVTIVAFRQNSTIESVISEIRRVPQVVVGVSNQQIARSQDNTAAQVMRRVPGITIVENRFVMIRGLSERYNNVMINNVSAPSTEVDKRTFSFDLISSGSLDKMLIYKSGTPDLPGDFAGGVIKLYTVDDVERTFAKVNFGLGYRHGTTGKDYFQSQGSKTDFLGFDGGFRRLPSGFPTSNTLQNSPRNSSIRIDAAHSLANNFVPEKRTFWADQSMGVTFGTSKTLGERLITNITSVGYSTGYQTFNREFKRYFEWTDESQDILQRFAYQDMTYQKDNKINLMSNWKFRLDRYNTLSFKNLFNQIGENETIIRDGSDFIQRPGDDLRNYLLGYRSRSIYNGQLEGTHMLGGGPHSLSWVAGGSYLREEEPDLRRFRTFRPRIGDDPFMMQMPPSSNLFDTGRYYGELNEYSLNHGLDYTFAGTSWFSTVKAGYVIDWRDRSFNSRYMSYLYPGFFDPTVRETLIRLPLNEIFSKDNVKNLNGFVLEEGTRPIDSYTASTLTNAAYVSTQIPLDKLTLIGGVRVEYNIMSMNSRDDFEVLAVRNPMLSLMPFLNTTYQASERTQIRLAYGRTVNRPEFRELAPFVFYDYKLDGGRVGNPDLNNATIDNVDLRFERYPRLGETITLGFFYKYFNNPIENKTIVTTETPFFGYLNADFAYSYGVEVEIRKSMQGLTGSAFLDRFAINANASLIYTKVDLGGEAAAESQTRPLQGQSPYILNAALYYDDAKNGLIGNLAYNVVGPRIYSVGDVLYPTIYEMPRHSLDLTLTQKVSRNMSAKFGITDILNAPYRFYQDSNRDSKVDVNNDHPISTYTRGRAMSLSVSYDF